MKLCEYIQCDVTYLPKRKESRFCSVACANKSRRVWEIQPDGTKKGFSEYQRARRYGLTKNEYEVLINNYQGSSCPICEKRPAVVIEHDHKTGVVRGMTCNACNTGLAAFGDDEAGVLRALAYIRNTSIIGRVDEGTRL